MNYSKLSSGSQCRQKSAQKKICCRYKITTVQDRLNIESFLIFQNKTTNVGFTDKMQTSKLLRPTNQQVNYEFNQNFTVLR